jgi:hypothetical protein
MIVKHGPLRHVATALVLPAGTATLPWAYSKAPEDLDPVLKRRCEKAAEDLVVAFESARGWDCERLGHLKIICPPGRRCGFNIEGEFDQLDTEAGAQCRGEAGCNRQAARCR